MTDARLESVNDQPGVTALALYYGCVAAFVWRIAWLDEWNAVRWSVLGVFALTAYRDRIAPDMRNLRLGVVFFGVLSYAVLYLPDLWFSIAYQLNHAQNYLWNANDFMRELPGNDASFLWNHRVPWFDALMRWIYVNGFDMVVWIPVVRSLCALDARKMARYALSAHLMQFPLIMPFYTAIRVDEVWSVLGHPDRCERGWSDATRLDLGANCFPSMHTSVAFAVLLLSLREKSRAFRVMMVVYSSSIIFSTMYMEIHWVIDVFAGLLLGWGAVKLVDLVLERVIARTGDARALENASS